MKSLKWWISDSMSPFICSRRGGATLRSSIITGPGIGPQPVDALVDDAVRLAHLLDAHQITVVAIAVEADRDVEVHAVVDLVGLLLAQIPFDARAAQHGPGEAELQRALRAHHADVDRALLPDAVVGEQRLVLVDAGREAPR